MENRLNTFDLFDTFLSFMLIEFMLNIAIFSQGTSHLNNL